MVTDNEISAGGTAVLWSYGDGDGALQPGAVRAFDAGSASLELTPQEADTLHAVYSYILTWPRAAGS